MKKLAKTLSVISAVLLLFALLVGALLNIYVDQAWVPQEYWKLDIESQTDWDFTTTVTAFKGMLDYSIGRIDTAQAAQTYDQPYFGDTGEGVNRFIIDGHRRLLETMKRDSSLVPASLPGMAQIRTSRRIEGAYELSEKDANAHFEDNIGGTGDWRRPGPVYEIPYRTLYTAGLKNVLSAGRCISTAGEAWEIVRCIPQAALTGQAAGTALTMAIASGETVQALDVAALRDRLATAGVLLDINKKDRQERPPAQKENDHAH